MVTVTAVETQRSPGRKVKVHLDTGSALNLSLAVVVEAGIHQGQRLSKQEITRLKDSDRLDRALECALRIIALRPRSEREIGDRLARRGFGAATTQRVVATLRKRDLADDAAFARFWLETRERFRPRARRLMELELKQKGVDADTITEALAGVDDEQGAYRAAEKRIRSLSGLAYTDFRRRLGSFLQRRGFSYAVVVRTVDRVWHEQGNECRTSGKEGF
jgi:regulatory protein